MSRIDLGNHRTVRVGSTEPFYVLLPAPHDNVALTYPEVTFKPFGGAESAASMARLFEPQAVASVSGDQIELDAALSTAVGCVGSLGHAWLRSDRSGVQLVQIQEIAGTVVTLSEPLPFSVDASGTCTLESAIWQIDLTASETGTATQTTLGNRPVQWWVTWSAQTGANVPAEPSKVGGLLSVVRQPFSTGLDPVTLTLRYPELRRAIPGGFDSLWPYIVASEAEVALAARQHLLGMPGLQGIGTEHDVDGAPLLEAHAALAAARMWEATNPTRGALLREQARGLLKSGLALVWVDTNRNGQVDGAEAQTQVSTTQLTQIGRPLRAAATGRRFTIGGRR